MHIFTFNVHILCIWLLIPAYKLHIYAYFIAYACILLLIQYLFLHILCMFLHICCLYHAYSCIVSMHIFAYLYIFCHFVAYLLHIHAFVCIFEHILMLTMQHSTFIASALAILHEATSWTTRTLPRSLHTTTGSHPPPLPLSHRTHHQSLQSLLSCCRGWCGVGAVVPHWNQWELGQDGRDRQNI